MSKSLIEIEPFQDLQEGMDFDIDPTQIIVRENEIKYEFRFQSTFGREVVSLSAIWNLDRKRFYFQIEDFSPTQDESMITEREFLRTLNDLPKKSRFTISTC